MRQTFGFIVLSLLMVGCGSGTVIPVNGIVTWDKDPLAGAAVTFYPDGKGSVTGGTARTGTDGKFVILGAKGENGLPPGTYKVTVSKLKGEATDAPVLAAPSETELRKDLPAIYSDPARTQLSFSVTGDGKPIEIKLSSGKKK